ncbi:MAG: ABC transporter substrate-binding protein [Clostridia bacterium]|nr:ABC transporter substrate-binding protein [Clostridia bacterium]
MKRILCVLMAAMLMLAGLSFAAADEAPVNVVLYLWGGEGNANQDILAELNKVLIEKINCTLEVRYIDWGDIATKYPMIFISDEFDMSFVQAQGDVPFSTLANQGSIIEITDEMLAEVPTLRDAISATNWDGCRVNGKIYAVPCLYSEFTPYGFAYRTSYLEKYGLEKVTSWETMEAYLEAVKAEDFPPINGNSSDANVLFRMFTDSTADLVYAPGISQDQVYLTASPAEPTKLSSLVYSDEFVDFCKKMQDWNNRGFFAMDALAASTSAKDNTHHGVSAGYLAHMPDWTGSYGTVNTDLPGEYVDWWAPAVDNGKIVNKAGADNAAAISTTSKHPIETLKVIEQLMCDETCYRLFQYGIYGRQYEIENGMAVTPASYDDAVDGGGFCGWNFRNDAFNLPYESEDPVRYTLIEEWKKTCIESPYVGFNLDTDAIKSELAAISDVNAQYGVPLLLGKVEDVDAKVAEYREMLTMAGIDTVIAEVEAQLTAFFATK